MPIGMSISRPKSTRASGKVRRALRQRMEDAMDAGFAVSQDEVPIDRGTLLGSGYQPTWDGDTIRFGYRADHAAAMEHGTDPYWPPTEPLLNWAERVLGDRQAGYAVQAKIAQEGVDAQPYMQPAAEEVRRFLRSRGLRQYLDREFRR